MSSRRWLLALSIVLLAVAVGAALITVPAAAKEGVRATLEQPVRLGAQAGQTIRVAWRLLDENGRRFGASGIYLRVSRCGRGPLMVPAAKHGHGRYVARVNMPQGGVRKLIVGLKGWRIIGKRTQRADVFFQFDPVLSRRCA